jgi:hypothetical protein
MSVKTTKMLWGGRAANRCAICRMELVMEATETDDASVVGEACHIVAQSEEGPRGNSELTRQQRDSVSRARTSPSSTLSSSTYLAIQHRECGDWTQAFQQSSSRTHVPLPRSPPAHDPLKAAPGKCVYLVGDFTSEPPSHMLASPRGQPRTGCSAVAGRSLDCKKTSFYFWGFME